MPGARRDGGPTPMPHAARRVAVVGAGAAGLAAARELLRDGHAVRVFEKSSRAGGTWAYDPRADDDAGPLLGRDPGAVHSSMYASLRTNLPRELMGFSGFPLAGRAFAGDPRTFPGHREILAFLHAFAEESGVAKHVRFRTEVIRVAPLLRQGTSEQWTVEWRGEDGAVAEEVFDAIVVCTGHCTVPLVPKIRGIDKWQGKQVHSHNYRVPEPYRYYFPFLDLDGFTVDDNRVGPLYKHVFPPKYAPNLSFIGLPSKSIVFQSFELEAKWVVAVLSGRVTLPSEEDMLAAVLKDYRRMEEAGTPKRHTHVLWPEWVEYFNWLADQVGEPHLEARRYEMYEKAIKCILSLDESYRDRWDEQEKQWAS
ncbi:hypothetical protein PR202_gb07409 [Eleusine coracana subsp. coracana]|uniref:Flavin-containing monooxygenase n=1 Tax=Eleusine coracana subsp. coracana TaxID=191504 RepID=A0AAV5EC28_ELECO|nr:hypothetical protein PR202_gb07409 [Eleusine coracana subsp. coracana]